MNAPRKMIVGAALMLGALAASLPASAHGPRSRVYLGVHVGVPAYSWWGPHPYWYYPAPVYVPAPVIVQQQPTVYVEQAPVQAQPQAATQNWWYYCADSRAYYPYVKDCPAGWQRVSPQPAP